LQKGLGILRKSLFRTKKKEKEKRKNVELDE
jgi:hypothetical protein